MNGLHAQHLLFGDPALPGVRPHAVTGGVGVEPAYCLIARVDVGRQPEIVDAPVVVVHSDPVGVGSPFVYNKKMPQRTVAQERKRTGRPPTGINPLMAFRPLPPMRSAIEAYAKANEISLSDSIRRLVELGLKAKARCPEQRP